jgi:glycosyltransferase involved in cell wall biosynthesis
VSSDLRVLLDATSIPADRGGVGRYVDGLVSQLGAEAIVACQSRDAARFALMAPDATIVPASPRIESTAARLLWEQTVLPRLARRLGAEVIHSPHYTLPLATRVPRVVTFHDATFFSDPGVHTRVKRNFFRLWMRVSSRLARRLIVPSEATGRETRRYCPRATGKIVVAHHGYDAQTFHRPTASELDSFRARHDIDGPWIAFLGTLEPRKNLPALVEAYGRLRRARQNVAPLLIAGARGWEHDPLTDGEDGPRLMGFLPLDELAAFLGGAELVCYPSLGEGFGLPVLEAMACGAPVLTTRRLALPEVGGDAVAYAEPDAEALATALGELLSDPAALAALRKAGPARASRFTWAACAARHRDAYRQAMRHG